MHTAHTALPTAAAAIQRPRATALLAILAGFVVAAAAAAQTPSIRFSAEVPAAPAQMQVYRLAPTSAPVDFINEKLVAARLPALQTEDRLMVARGATGQTDLDRVRVFVDPVSGDTHFVPNLAELVSPTAPRAPMPIDRLQSLGRAALADVRFIPKDVTETRVSDAIPVMGGATARGAAAPAAQTVMTLVPAVRYAAGLPVYGRGSHALVALANDGTVVGALRRWRTASLGDRIQPSVTADQVRADIQRQLTPYVAQPGSSAVVDKIELAYYDGNADYLQPVYRFEATLTPGVQTISITKIAGYVAVGTPLEPIPDLAAAPSGAAPGTTRSDVPIRSMVPHGDTPTANDITLGEFVNQDWPTSSAYLDMANSFYSGLSSGSQPVTRTIWWTAYPWQVVGSQSTKWMNAVNVAYTEPHGDWLVNTTQSNCCQPWYITQIGTGGAPGYGHAAGGVLATWLIMSCEVLPSVYDRQNQVGGPGDAFAAWWPVFQGLHNVFAFRTVMFYPDDALNYGFGSDAARGGDVNAAWFDEVAAVDGNDGTYANKHLVGSPTVHYDRASSMVDGRDLGQSIFSVGAQSASSTLWNFWMGN
jgi:hypothetical protein